MNLKGWPRPKRPSLVSGAGAGERRCGDDLALFKISAEHQKPEMDKLRRAIAHLLPEDRRREHEAEIAREPKPVREAAREFRSLAGSAASEEGLEDRLRRKARTPLTARDMAEIEALFDPAAPHTRTIFAILEMLEDLGVQSETIWDENP